MKQAIAIANSSQFLVGSSFDKYYPNTTPIICIAACPADESLMERFVEDYDSFGTTDLADYEAEQYFDVVVIARHLPDREVCIHVPLKTFLKNQQEKMVA
ncbi:MAG: hypothetical protein EOP49_29660 [Sphingobacteriales bacterium]|nr:MAG: hypothetical protein EOP49_29660 [Sphingobacteriales bacterium]